MFVAVALLVSSLTASPVNVSNLPKTFQQISKDADAARVAEKIPDAIRLYREGVRLRPAWSDGWFALGTLFYDQDRFPEAQSAFRRFAAVSKEPGPAYAFLGLCEYETQDYENALRHFRLWANQGWSGTPELKDVAVFHFALLLTREGRFVEALYLLATEAAKKRSPALIEAMGLASLRMRALPEDYPQDKRELIWLAGEAAFFASTEPQDLPSAHVYAGRLLRHYAQEPNVHYFRATLFKFERKNAEETTELLEELKISPNHVPAMIELARIYIDDNKLNEARSLAQQAVKADPKSPEARHILGQFYLAAEMYEDSVRELEIAKQLAPDAPLIRFHLARAYSAVGKKGLAQQEVSTYKLLKDKEQILVSPQDKLRMGGKRP